MKSVTSSTSSPWLWLVWLAVRRNRQKLTPLSALLPAPSETSGTPYRVLHRVLNVLAANVGRAKNADESGSGKKAA